MTYKVVSSLHNPTTWCKHGPVNVKPLDYKVVLFQIYNKFWFLPCFAFVQECVGVFVLLISGSVALQELDGWRL